MTSLTRRKKRYLRIKEKRCKSVRFQELRSLLEMHEWVLHRVARNSHYIFVHSDYVGIVNVPKPHGADVKSVYCRHALKAIQEVAGYDE